MKLISAWPRKGSRFGRAVLRPIIGFLARNRRKIRNSELRMVAAVPLVAVPVGAAVALLHRFVNLMHRVFFDLPAGARLSGEDHPLSAAFLLVPMAGGLILGLTRHFAKRGPDAESIVDPIEANALYGGNMSLKDSLRLLISNLTSNGCGASVGMEAGFTQIGAALFSGLGRILRLRREDRRIFVTAGAAAAISAAFDAPLTGAFYGFELVYGGYAPRALAPVAVAAVIGAWMTRAWGTDALVFNIPPEALHLDAWVYPAGLMLGLGAALIGIFAMTAASTMERALRLGGAPVWLLPTFAGLIVGILAMGSPQILGSGQAAIQFHLSNAWDMAPLIVVLIAKIAASVICLGSGFRGGLFSSSLLMGCLYGAVMAGVLALFDPALASEGTVLRLMGMSAMGASIIGAPLTMAFLVLETTRDLGVTVAALSGILAASAVTRIKFGYSFATWRFHMRGLALRGAHDVGWVRDVTVARLMSRDVRLVAADMPLAALRAATAPGAAARLFTVDAAGRYVGAIETALLHDPAITDAAQTIIAADLATGRTNVLTPADDIQAALKKFDGLRVEALPVVDNLIDQRVVGYLTETLALRRYTEELERHSAAPLGIARA